MVVRNDISDDKKSWVATLACSPGRGVGVLECWGVCTKSFKHTNQLNPARMQTFRHEAEGGLKYSPQDWNLPRSRQLPRKVPPTAAETERASTSVGRMVVCKGEKVSEAIREVLIANTSAWVSGTPLSTAPQGLSPLSTCSSITCQCEAERPVSRSSRCLAVIETEPKPGTAVPFSNL